MLAAELIRRPSVTPKDEGALDIVAARLERLGFTCHRLDFRRPANGEPTAPIANLYARLRQRPAQSVLRRPYRRGADRRRRAMVVRPVRRAALRDGVLCGRGAVDMKGAIAAFIAAAERFSAARGARFHRLDQPPDHRR